MRMVTPNVTKRLSEIQFAVETRNPSSPSLSVIVFLPQPCNRGAIKTIPSVDIKVNWK